MRAIPSKNPMEENYLPNVDYFRSTKERLRELENNINMSLEQIQKEGEEKTLFLSFLEKEKIPWGSKAELESVIIADYFLSRIKRTKQESYQSGEKAMLEKVLGEIEGMYKNGTGCGCYSFDKALNSLKEKLLTNK